MGDMPSDRDRPMPKRAAEGGEGATAADVERGYLDLSEVERPESEMANYKGRHEIPKGGYARDWDFLDLHREADGFLTRPRAPYER